MDITRGEARLVIRVGGSVGSGDTPSGEAAEASPGGVRPTGLLCPLSAMANTIGCWDLCIKGTRL